MTDKLLVILDLDNTLIDSKIVYSFTNTYKYKVPDAIIQDPIIDGFKQPIEIYLYSRPHLDEFLDYCFEHFTVALWTAAEDWWRDAILDLILYKYKDRFLFTWSRNQTILKFGKALLCTKSLAKVWKKFPKFNENNTLLIDDYANVTGNPSIEGKCQLQIKKFSIENDVIMDCELPKILCILQFSKLLSVPKMIKIYNNVRS